MKTRTSLMLCVVAALCLANVAQASTWNVANDNWSNLNAWSPVGVPNNTSVIIGNDGVCNLDYAAPSITTLAIQKNSTLNILPNAVLNGSGTNNWVVGDTVAGNYTSRVYQTGGCVTDYGDMYLGDDTNTYGEYYLSGGSLTLNDDLKCADDGGGKFVLSGEGSFTVHGYISISNKATGHGRMEISGGTLNQIGDKVEGATDNHRISVGESTLGELKLTGGLATINVTTYDQRANGTLEVLMNGTGISTINASENLLLAGSLVVSFAPGDRPANGVYDLIKTVTGTRTGTFTNVTLDPDVTLSYETGSSIVRLTVVPEPATLALLGLGGLGLILRRKRR